MAQQNLDYVDPGETLPVTFEKIQENFDETYAHLASTSNPHSVTKSQVGLGNADNTADTAKPVSTAQQTALDLKANLASPALTGTPTAPTAAAATNSTQIATTAFVRGEVSALVDSSPGTLDTLNELAAALGDDPNFATTTATSLSALDTRLDTVEDQLGGTTPIDEMDVTLLNVENFSVSRTLGTDDTYKGYTLSGINAGATIAQWELVYYSFSDGEWMLADANGSSTYPAAGIATGASTNGAALTVMTTGFVRNDAWSWSAGPIYLSATPGALTQTAPSTSGDKVQPVGYAISADVAYFHFNQTFVEVA